MNTVSFAVGQLPSLIPGILVYLIGAGIALARFGQFRRPASLILAGCSLLLMNSIMFPFIQGAILQYRDAAGSSLRDTGLLLSITGFIRSLLYATGFALVLAAALVDRSPVPFKHPMGDGFDYAIQPSGGSSRGVLILMLGILGLMMCGPLGLVALILGASDLAAMRAGRMDRSGEGPTLAGMILGIVGTIVTVLGVVAAAFWFLARTTRF